jgi:hypothetical protein
MMVQDGQGRWWMIGYETGQWYYHDGEKWVSGTPTTSTGPTGKNAIKKPVSASGLWLSGIGGSILLLLGFLLILANLLGVTY